MICLWLDLDHTLKVYVDFIYLFLKKLKYRIWNLDISCLDTTRINVLTVWNLDITRLDGIFCCIFLYVSTSCYKLQIKRRIFICQIANGAITIRMWILCGKIRGILHVYNHTMTQMCTVSRTSTCSNRCIFCFPLSAQPLLLDFWLLTWCRRCDKHHLKLTDTIVRSIQVFAWKYSTQQYQHRQLNQVL
jgi:hypothetical protein